MHDPARQTEAQQNALKEAAAKTKQECETAWKRGYTDASEGRNAKGFPEKDLNKAYQQGYARGQKGMKIKL